MFPGKPQIFALSAQRGMSFRQASAPVPARQQGYLQRYFLPASSVTDRLSECSPDRASHGWDMPYGHVAIVIHLESVIRQQL